MINSSPVKRKGKFRPLKPGEAFLFSQWEKNERRYPWKEEHFLESHYAKFSETLVWASGKEILGYAVIQVIRDDAYLMNIMVHPGRRREGLGRELLRKVIAWAGNKDARKLILEVDPENKGAMALYRSLNFEVVGERKRAYPHGENAVVMYQSISPRDS